MADIKIDLDAGATYRKRRSLAVVVKDAEPIATEAQEEEITIISETSQSSKPTMKAQVEQ